MPVPATSKAEQSDYCLNAWVWDDGSTPTEVELSTNKEAAYFFVDPVLQSTGTVAVRGSKGFAEGEHYWEIVFLEPPIGTSVMVGVGTMEADIRSDQNVNLIGRDSKSWGLSYKGQLWHGGKSRKYCEPFYAQGTVIGLHLDLNLGQLTIYKDGVSLGPAFTGLRASRQHRVFPMVSSTSTETELGLGKRISRLAQPYCLLVECMDRVRRSVSGVDAVDQLPLPGMVKSRLKEMDWSL